MNIFVGCSSTNSTNEAYNNAARNVGMFIKKRNHNLVFGGCKNGLMGEVYKSVATARHSKIIVTTVKRYQEDLQGMSYNEVYVSDTINERKNDILKLADIFLFLPGGIGTVDELLTAIETKRSGEHSKPIIICNINGYFDSLLAVFEKIDSRFSKVEVSKMYDVISDIEYLEKLISREKDTN